MRCFRLVCTLWLSALAMPCAAQAPTPAPAKPALIINDPFAAPLWRIDVDADENHLVAGSPAKAAAVWSLDDPSAAELLRLPLREEEMQRAHAIAISPDGKHVAAAVPPLRDDKGFAQGRHRRDLHHRTCQPPHREGHHVRRRDTSAGTALLAGRDAARRHLE